MNTVLFLCSGNYYRSRFAEIYFNHLANETELDWRAESRGIVAQWSKNPGPVSPETLRGLAARSIRSGATRYPMQLGEHDLTRAARVIALYEIEHRGMLDAYFPAWSDRVTYWQVPDLGELDPGDALALIERNTRALVNELSHAGVSI